MSKLVEIKFTLDLDKPGQVQSFINVLADFTNASTAPTEEAMEANLKPAPKAKRKTAAKPKVKKEEPAQEETTESTVKVEDVRALVAEKARDHRAEVKAKLSELGAANVTTLEESKYQEFVDFLSAL